VRSLTGGVVGEAECQLVVSHDGAIVVATLQSRHPSHEEVCELRAELIQLLEDRETKDVVLDFRKVNYLTRISVASWCGYPGNWQRVVVGWRSATWA
jgi:hypothetical protein